MTRQLEFLNLDMLDICLLVFPHSMLQRGKNAVQQNMNIAKECQAWKCTILKQCTRTYTHICFDFSNIIMHYIYAVQVN